MRASGFILLAIALALFLIGVARNGGLERFANMPWQNGQFSGERFEGIARVTDGDTLKINGTRIRIAGIDAPESDQTCATPSGRIWRCGDIATAALGKFVAGQIVTCIGSERDRNRRVIATCSTEGQDIGGWMVQSGWAMAYRRYATTYVGRERQAKSQRAGIWVGTVQPPWEWRAAR